MTEEKVSPDNPKAQHAMKSKVKREEEADKPEGGGWRAGEAEWLPEEPLSQVGIA